MFGSRVSVRSPWTFSGCWALAGNEESRGGRYRSSEDLSSNSGSRCGSRDACVCDGCGGAVNVRPGMTIWGSCSRVHSEVSPTLCYSKANARLCYATYCAIAHRKLRDREREQTTAKSDTLIHLPPRPSRCWRNGHEEGRRPYAIPPRASRILEEIPGSCCCEPRDFERFATGRPQPSPASSVAARALCNAGNQSVRPRAESVLEARRAQAVSPAVSHQPVRPCAGAAERP